MKKTTIHFNPLNGVSLRSDGWVAESSADHDFWRVFLDTGENRELAVYSHCQTLSGMESAGDTVVYHYDRLVAEDGQVFDIKLELTVAEENGHLVFTSMIENNSQVILNELQYPFISSDDFGCASDKEVLFVPDGLGARIPNPRSHVASLHTEYMAADYKSIWKNYTYPASYGSYFLTMPWLGLQCGDKYLYIGEHNPEIRIVGFNVGVPPRHAHSELMFCISHYPAAQPSEKISIGRSVIALFDGDWRDGTAFYREWSEKTWFVEQNIPDWVKNMVGWQRVICKHQYGEIFWKYSDLPKLWEEGMRYGLNGIMVFGWWKGRFDNNYPEFEPDPALGGEQALKDAIAEIQKNGGHVLLYTNGNLIDIKTDFYKRIGQRISHKDIDGNEYREHYKFSNDGSVLKNFGYKSFDTACQTTTEWHDNLLKVARLKLSFDPDSIFFDQLSYSLKLCFDKSHPHGNRIDLDGMGRLDNIRAIREILPPNKAIGFEYVNDRYCNLVDYIHGFGSGMTYEQEDSSLPDIFLDTFPQTNASNRGLHDDKEGFRNHLNFAFTYGLIFDVSIYRGRRIGVAGLPEYAEYLKKLIDIRNEYSKYFCLGRFATMYGEPLPNVIRAAKFKADDGSFIVSMWNTDSKDVTFTLYGKEITVKANDVGVAEFSK